MINKNGLEYYEVGGSVRDELLGREPTDRDFVVVGETEETMKDRGFERIDAESFPIFLDESGREFALARTERSTGDGYKDFDIETENVTLKEDLRRRDFTMNAIAKNPETGEHIEPDGIGAIDDVENGIIRHLSGSFEEDPLRILRMARFAARFEFDIEDETMKKAVESSQRLETVSNERIGDEIVKAMKQADQPSRYFDILHTVGAFEHIYEPLSKMPNIPAGEQPHHMEGSVLQHSLMVVEEMYKIRGNDPKALLMAYIHDIGKVVTGENNRENHGGHDKEGIELAGEFADRVRFSNDMKRALKDASRHHMRIHYFVDDDTQHRMRWSKIIDVVDSLRDGPGASIEQMIDLAKADSRGRIPEDEAPAAKMQVIADIVESTIDEIDAEYAMEKRDASLDEYEGEVIGDMIEQDRVEFLKDMFST